MCLRVIGNKREILKEAKKDGKNFIICYSIARKRKGKYWPLYYDRKPYKSGWNVSKKTNRDYEAYIPHFHRYIRYKDTFLNPCYWGNVVLEWKVPIKSITKAGLENGTYNFFGGKPVIVTRRCKLLGEVK